MRGKLWKYEKNTNKEIGRNGHRNNCPNNVSPVFSYTYHHIDND